MSIKNKKLKFLAVKLSALEAELKISRELLMTVSKEVDQMFEKRFFPEARLKEHQEEINVEDKEVITIEAKPEENEQESKQSDKEHKEEIHPKVEKQKDPQVKSLFKKIASKIHPDKLTNVAEYEKDKKEKLYDKAIEAMENNNLILLADIALELDLEVPDITEEKLKETEQKIIAIKKELNMIESTYVWRWFFTENPEAKENILKQLFSIMYEQKYGIRP